MQDAGTDRAAREGGWLPSLLAGIRTTEEIARQVLTPYTLSHQVSLPDAQCSEPSNPDPVCTLHPHPASLARLRASVLNLKPYTLKLRTTEEIARQVLTP